LWQRVFKEVAAEYRNSEIETQHMYVDALAMQMVRDPRGFDVIVTNNMFGDIISDLAAALQGGLGMAASGNLRPGYVSMFEPVHGSAPQIAGKNIANPFGAILSVAMMLAHLGMAGEAQKIEAAVLEAVRQKKNDGRHRRNARDARGGRLGGAEGLQSLRAILDIYFQDRGNMKLWKSAVVVLLFALLVGGAWSQNEPQSPAHSNSVDNLGLQVEDQNHDRPQTAPAQAPAGEGARATQETIVSSKRRSNFFARWTRSCSLPAGTRACRSSTK